MTTLDEFASKFRLDALTVVTTDHWTWSVLPIQVTLGAGVLSLNRLCPTFGEMTPAEGADLTTVVGLFEDRLRKVFDVDGFNYLTYMLADAHVHTMAVPRYGGPRTYTGETWEDGQWPGPASMGAAAHRLSMKQLVALRDRLALSDG